MCGKLTPLEKVPEDVIVDHLTRYSMKELLEVQFIAVFGSLIHYVFFMSHEAKVKRDRID